MQNIEVIHADITTLAVDAIVNAANEQLLGGGGVDGAIHRAAGPQLLESCRALPEVTPGIRCPIGEARMTPGFALKAQHVIHAVGPVWQGGTGGEPRLLAAAYRNSLLLAREQQLRSIAFPAISCGVYGYPINRAAGIAVRTILVFLAGDDVLERVQLVAFSAEIQEALEGALKAPMR
jgi:O-acetyl-ADP-ribose deacetylase (regulator of RNase III)